MKRLILLVTASLICVANGALSQGTFLFCNRTAPTRVGSINGPLAGTNIWARMLAGQTPESLAPIGPTVFHTPDGIVFGCLVDHVTVPGIEPGSDAFVQMLAWDGQLWGTVLEDVPLGQLGMTDIVSVPLNSPPGTDAYPAFTQPAIVPIPEPSVVMLGILAGSLAFVSRFARRHVRHPKRIRFVEVFPWPQRHRVTESGRLNTIGSEKSLRLCASVATYGHEEAFEPSQGAWKGSQLADRNVGVTAGFTTRTISAPQASSFHPTGSRARPPVHRISCIPRQPTPAQTIC